MSKIKSSISALIFSALILPSAFADEDKVLAIINGDPVKTSELLTYAKVKNAKADLSNDVIRKQMIQAYVGRELLYQDAIAQKIDQLPIVKLALENQRHEVISQALVAKIVQETTLTDKQLRAAYDKKAAELKTDNKEFPSYEQAKPQIAKLMIEQTIAQYIQTLQKKATIEKPK
ncbi:MAG: hypothetical protein L3J01_04235 [Thiomicrorhabdus sp.]|nr:hypothetical protein [Thiomicrorhabdus sp.]